MRNRFDEQLFELNKEIIEMGAMCEEAIAKAVKADANLNSVFFIIFVIIGYKINVFRVSFL